jgi:hypothetical protein
LDFDAVALVARVAVDFDGGGRAGASCSTDLGFAGREVVACEVADRPFGAETVFAGSASVFTREVTFRATSGAATDSSTSSSSCSLFPTSCSFSCSVLLDLAALVLGAGFVLVVVFVIVAFAVVLVVVLAVGFEVALRTGFLRRAISSACAVSSIPVLAPPLVETMVADECHEMLEKVSNWRALYC